MTFLSPCGTLWLILANGMCVRQWGQCGWGVNVTSPTTLSTECAHRLGKPHTEDDRTARWKKTRFPDSLLGRRLLISQGYLFCTLLNEEYISILFGPLHTLSVFTEASITLMQMLYLSLLQLIKNLWVMLLQKLCCDWSETCVTSSNCK